MVCYVFTSHSIVLAPTQSPISQRQAHPVRHAILSSPIWSYLECLSTRRNCLFQLFFSLIIRVYSLESRITYKCV